MKTTPEQALAPCSSSPATTAAIPAPSRERPSLIDRQEGSASPGKSRGILIVVVAMGLICSSLAGAQDLPGDLFEELSGAGGRPAAGGEDVLAPREAGSSPLAGRQILIDPRWYGDRPIFGSFQRGYELRLKPKEIVLTFDDGPSPKTTPPILDALARAGVKATFFLQGDRAEKHPDIVRRMVAEGHTVGYHTYDHPKLTTLSDREVEANILAGIRAVNMAAYGSPDAPTTNAFRPPYLSFDRELLTSLCKKHAMALFSIDGDPKDYRNRPAAELLEDVDRTVSTMGKGMILFHDTQENTAEAMPSILRNLASEGYLIVDLKMNDR